MSILDAIHAERKLTLKHWRFRLLHWCFNQRDVEFVSDSDLPRYLYSHYCPLFHITNFIALFSWLIAAIKITSWCVKGSWRLFSKINWGFMSVDLFAIFKVRRQRVERIPTREELVSSQWGTFERRIRSDEDTGSFERFWERHSLLFSFIDEAEAKAEFERLQEVIKAENERKEILRKRVDKIVMAFVTLGRVCVKGIFNLSAVAGAALIVWAVYSFTGPVTDFIVFFAQDVWSFLVSIEIMSVMKTGLTILGITALITGIVLLTRKREAPQGLYDFSVKAGNTIAWPFVSILKILWMPLNFIGIGILKAKEFVEVFCENNCPPITIIDEEELT